MIIKPGPNVTPYKPAVKPPTKPVGNPTEKPVGVAVTPPKATAPSNPYGLDPAVYSAVSPQLTYLDQVQAQNQAALEGLTKAIMSQLGGMSGQIGDQYNQGIQQQQALAQAGSDSLRQANPNASVQSLLGAIGAPASQGDQIANNLANTFGGGAAATFGRQGVLPVTRLIGDKLLQQNFASELPGIQGVAATNALKNLLASSNNEKLKVLAQVPQIQSDLAKSKMDQQKFALDQQKAASDLFFKNANLGLAKRKDAYNEWLGQKKLGLASQNQSFSQWAKTQGLKIQGQRVNIAQQNANTSAARAAQSYDVQLQRLGISQAHLSLDQQKFVEQARKNEAKAKRGNFTPSQMARFRGAANRIAANSFKGIEDPKNPGKFLAPPLKDDPNGFQKAVLEMFQSKAGAIPLTVSLKALNRYWKVPGQGGRPYQELPLRQRLKGKAEAAQGAAYQPTAYTGKLSSTQLPQLAQQALAIAAPKYANNANVQALVGRIMQESGGNPAAINLWDSNAKSGHPSKGILQTIDSTFNAYALPGHTDIWNPLDNAIAAVRYMLARYGHIVGPSGTGY